MDGKFKMNETEYKISIPREKEKDKSFTIHEKDGKFKGTLYISAESVYISLVEMQLKSTPKH
jgi:hypothetical protein